jgi:phosphotransferase system  glucose/maltose/N-acetylglucosamine-specific IIC component
MTVKEKFSKLVDVKSIVTFGLVGTLCFLAIRQDTPIPTELLTAVVTAVITYFFTRKQNEAETTATTTTEEQAPVVEAANTIGFKAPESEAESDD